MPSKDSILRHSTDFQPSLSNKTTDLVSSRSGSITLRPQRQARWSSTCASGNLVKTMSWLSNSIRILAIDDSSNDDKMKIQMRYLQFHHQAYLVATQQLSATPVHINSWTWAIGIHHQPLQTMATTAVKTTTASVKWKIHLKEAAQLKLHGTLTI